MSAAAPARTPVLRRDDAVRLAATEYTRTADLLGSLATGEWRLPTECPGWDVRAVAGHVLGMARMVSSPVQFVRQNAGAARAGGGIDALTALQVRQEARHAPQEVGARLTALAPRAVRGRRRLAAVLGRVPVPEVQVVGDRRERWTFGYLLDVVLTRDTWMHRIDVARATGRDPVLTPAHDGALVDDVVREWAHRHGRPHRLTLTGPAGGTWSTGTDAEELVLDAVEFCRVLSGRGAAAGLLAQPVPF